MITITPADFASLEHLIASLPTGEQIYIDPLLGHVKGRLLKGDVSGAIAALQTFPVPTATLQVARNAAVAFLQAKLP